MIFTKLLIALSQIKDNTDINHKEQQDNTQNTED